MYVSHEDRIIQEIAGTLWRGVYLKTENIGDEVLIALAHYVRRYLVARIVAHLSLRRGFTVIAMWFIQRAALLT